jgi:hypothetical protein
MRRTGRSPRRQRTEHHPMGTHHHAPRISCSPVEASRITGLSMRTVKRLIAEGALIPHAVGHRSMILISDIETYIRAQPRTVRRPRLKQEA